MSRTRRVSRFADHDVFIGRPSYWGNPFVTGPDGTRDEVIAKHRADFLANPAMVAKAKLELTGKRLACYCGPKTPCHGDVYVEVCS